MRDCRGSCGSFLTLALELFVVPAVIVLACVSWGYRAQSEVSHLVECTSVPVRNSHRIVFLQANGTVNPNDRLCAQVESDA